MNGVLVGELNLEEVSRFAGLLSSSDDVLTIIVDRRGNIVGHPDPVRALRGENLKHLAAPLSGRADSPVTANFRLDAIDYLGSTTPIPETGWTALVTQPTSLAIVGSTLVSLGVASAIALLMAVIVGLIVSRRMMRRMRQFATHVEAVADGHYEAKIPHSASRRSKTCRSTCIAWPKRCSNAKPVCVKAKRTSACWWKARRWG